MHVVRYPNAAAFLADAEPFLLEAEAENNLILGIARNVARQAGVGGMAPYFAAVHDGNAIQVCAFQTIPDRVGVTQARSLEALASLAADIAAACPEARLVLGLEPTVARLAELVAAGTGRRALRDKGMRLHELRAVDPVEPSPPGSLRPARAEDIDLITEWIRAFHAMTGDPGDALQIASARVLEQSLFVWDDDGPVSMAAWAGRTPNGLRINYVYTPPELRGRGYATACVAALSRALLDAGNRYCCLYTDLANPTSNAIYRRIGYRPVCDAAMYKLRE